jgi:hypothetical protein
MATTEKTTDEPGSSTVPKRPRRRIPVWLRIVLGVSLYFLSIGPLFWFWYEAENMGGWPFLRVFYFPLRLACGIEIVEELVNDYINWWIS